MRDTRMLVLIGMLAAAAFILMATVQVPVLPTAGDRHSAPFRQ